MFWKELPLPICEVTTEEVLADAEGLNGRVPPPPARTPPALWRIPGMSLRLLPVPLTKWLSRGACPELATITAPFAVALPRSLKLEDKSIFWPEAVAPVPSWSLDPYMWDIWCNGWSKEVGWLLPCGLIFMEVLKCCDALSISVWGSPIILGCSSDVLPITFKLLLIPTITVRWFYY